MGSSLKTLGVVIRTVTENNHDDLWEQSAFWNRILSAVDAAVVYGGSAPGGILLADTMSDLAQALQDSDAETLVLVQDNQLFLDPAIVLHGLELLRTMDRQWDYFTQWEHCRLPVGIGARMLNMRHVEIPRTEPDLDVFLQTFCCQPDVACRYDDTQYVEYEASLLDSRYLPGTPLPQVVSHKHLTALAEGSPPLSLFLDIAQGRSQDFAYDPSQQSMYQDERGMPTPIGFESCHCAQFPSYIMFDVTNVCNSRCIHCPHSLLSADKNRVATHISWEHFTRVVDQCAGQKLDFVRFTADGEPLLHPRLAEMLDYARSKKVGPVGLTTNGMLMNEKTATRILESGLFLVDFSVDAASRETYSIIRRGLDYDKVVNNIRNFITLRDRMHPSCKVMVSFVEQEANRHETNEFEKLWSDVADKVLIRSLITNVNLVHGDDKRPSQSRFPCPHPFRRVVVTYDGRYKYCPVDWENRTCVGNVADISLSDLWHGAGYHAARLDHLNLQFEHCRACRDCPDWQGSPWKLGYEKVIASLKPEEL